MRKTLLLGIALGAMVLGTTGCHFYFDDGDDGWGDPRGNNGGPGGYSFCDDSGCYWCEGDVCYPEDGACTTDDDCAAGCICDADTGACLETGFCASDNDCPYGMVCDRGRETCTNETEPVGPCTSDAACGSGDYCDEASGECVPSWTCNTSEDCGPGFECNDNGTCEPVSCTEDAQCEQGCFCDTNTNSCVETGTCTADDQCGDDMQCDEERGTCIPCGADGCLPPPPACAELTDELACQERTDCDPLWNGINCSCQYADGTSVECDPESPPEGTIATCEQWPFAACVDSSTP